MNYDNSSHTSSHTSTSVRDILSGAMYNEAEIVPASRECINRLNPEQLHGLETIPVTPEAPWDQRGEVLLHNWMDEAKVSATKHRSTAYRLKRQYRVLSVAVIISTGFVFLLTSMFPCDTEIITYKYIKVFASFFSLIIANLSSFYDYGPKYQSHFQYDGHFTRYYIDIQEILATDTEFRPPKDKTIVEFRERMGNLISSAPEV